MIYLKLASIADPRLANAFDAAAWETLASLGSAMLANSKPDIWQMWQIEQQCTNVHSSTNMNLIYLQVPSLNVMQNWEFL